MKRTKSAIAMIIAVVLCITAACPVMGSEKRGETPMAEDIDLEEAKGTDAGNIPEQENAKESETGEKSEQENVEDDVIYDIPQDLSTSNEQASAALELKGSEFPSSESDQTDELMELLWKECLPRVWVGEYDGNHETINWAVRRKYAILIQEIEENTVTGIAFIEKMEGREYQVRGSYFFRGTLDYSTRSIVFRGTSFIDPIENFSFLTFSVTIDKEMQKMTGSTNAFAGATVDLKAATSANTSAYWNDNEDNWFAYKEDELNPRLALECMKNNLLMYGDSIDLGIGFYTLKKKEGYHVLQEKLRKEGFSTLGVLCSPRDEVKDCIHWTYAHKELSDGSELVYVIIKGTYHEEWYGDFNLTGPGDVYEDENQHYSFFHATNSLKQNLEEYLGKGGIKNKKITYLITGHSRGAACANILGKMLTDEKREGDRVFCYTFATPTVIKKSLIPEDSYHNIFNFCLDDDFVTYLPLENSSWQYGRYGKTYYANAAKLYQDNSDFKAFIQIYHNNSKETVSYKRKGAYDIADKLNEYCSSIEQFYIKDRRYIIGQPVHGEPVWDKASWYDFFQNWLAPIMYDNQLAVLRYDGNEQFNSIKAAFLGGGIGYAREMYSLAAHLGNTHDAKSYYAWMMCLEKNTGVISETSLLRGELADKYDHSKKTGQSVLMTQGNEYFDENDISALTVFANTDGNLEKLGWDLESPATWHGVTWNENGKISELDLNALDLTGTLDVSSLDELEVLDCGCNQLTDLIIGDVALKELSCEGNFLELYTGSDLSNIIGRMDQAGGFVCSYYPQCMRIEADFSKDDLNKLTNLANTANNFEKLDWDLDNPASFDGIDWTSVNGTYYVDNIDLNGYGLTGDIDLSGFDYLTRIDLGNNSLSSVSFSNNNVLKGVDVSDNEIVNISYDGCDNLQSLICSGNCLDEYKIRGIKNYFGSQLLLLEISNQRVLESADRFDQAQLAYLQNLLENVDVEIDWSHPGANDRLKWVLSNGKYVISGIDLSETDIEGTVDLTGLLTLMDINFAYTKVKIVRLPSSIRRMDDFAFGYCKELTDLYIVGKWNDVGKDVFKGCDKLTIHTVRGSFAAFYSFAMNIPYEVDEVFAIGWQKCGDQAIWTCYSDGTVRITGTGGIKQVESGDGYLLWDYFNVSKVLNIHTVVVEEGITEIGNDTFAVKKVSPFFGQMSDSPEKIILADSVETIGMRAFYNCSNLETVVFGAGVSSIDQFAFSFCSSLKEILVSEDNETYKSVEGALLSKDGTVLYKLPGCGVTEYTVPNGVTTLELDCMADLTELKTVTIPNSVNTITSYAFDGSENITDVYFGGAKADWRAVSIGDKNDALEKATIHYAITDVPVKNCIVSFNETECIYNGSAWKPEATVTYKGMELVEGEDYSVDYKDNVNVGTAKVIITGNGDFSGSKTVEFSIGKATQSITVNADSTAVIMGKTVNISVDDVLGTLTCEVDDPSIASASVSGTMITVTGVKTGFTKLIIKAKGTANYNAAEQAIELQIVPGKTTRGDMFNLANNVKVTWKEVPGAKYYKVYREGITDPNESLTNPVIVTEGLIGWDKESGLTNGNAYRYKIVASLTGKGDSSGDSPLSYSKLMYRLKTVVIRSVKNTAPGKVTAKYDKTTSGDSYVLQYSEHEDMSNAKTKVVLGAENTSCTIGGLKKGKTYYFSIRVRKKVNGIDYYTTFGVAKKIKITQ